MKNPIPHSNLFATPESYADLEACIESLPKKDKALAYTYVMMALNLSHKMVEELRISEEV